MFMQNPRNFMQTHSAIAHAASGTTARRSALRTLIEEHVRRTGSLHAKTILDNWGLELRNFVHVVPKESLSRLVAPLELKAVE